MIFQKQYLTFVEYTALKGTLSEDAFNLLEYDARKKIDKETFGRLIELNTQKQEVKLCVFNLIGFINENNTTIKSQSLDGYNITLMDKKDLNNTFKSVINDYLSECKLDNGTPYLYRGADRC